MVYGGLQKPVVPSNRDLRTTLAADSCDMHSKLRCITFVILGKSEEISLVNPELNLPLFPILHPGQKTSISELVYVFIVQV